MSAAQPNPKARDHYQALLGLNKVLKEHIAAMPEADITRWLNELRTAYDRNYSHLQSMFKTQEECGMLDQLLERRPSLSGVVDRLKHEHGELLQMAESIRDDLAATTPEDRLLAADACARIQRFNAIVAQHEQRENMITMLVFNEELGAGD